MKERCQAPSAPLLLIFLFYLPSELSRGNQAFETNENRTNNQLANPADIESRCHKYGKRVREWTPLAHYPILSLSPDSAFALPFGFVDGLVC